MSAPEYKILSGINGTEVAAKVHLLNHPSKRQLLFFIQAQSLEPGGLRKMADDFLAVFPDRIGTPAMHRLGTKPGKVYSGEDAKEICRDLDLHEVNSVGDDFEYPTLKAGKLAVEDAVARCYRQFDLPNFLIGLCTNPNLPLFTPDEPNADRNPGLKVFKDLVPALFAYQQLYSARLLDNFVMTAPARQIFKVADRVTRSRKIGIVEGREGIGKTESLKTYCKSKPWEFRFFSLKGISDRTSFFNTLCEGFGLPSGRNQSVADMRVRTERFMRVAKIGLAIDEGHYLLPQGERIRTQPELLNWLYTSCTNFGIPVLLSTTSLFYSRLARLEHQIKSNAWQFLRRNPYYELLNAPLPKEVEAIAKKLLPANADLIDYAMTYSLGTKKQYAHLALDRLVNVIDEARLIAEDDSKKEIGMRHLMQAVRALELSDAHKEQRFQWQPQRPGRAARAPSALPVEEELQRHFTPPATPVQAEADEDPNEMHSRLMSKGAL